MMHITFTQYFAPSKRAANKRVPSLGYGVSARRCGVISVKDTVKYQVRLSVITQACLRIFCRARMVALRGQVVNGLFFYDTSISYYASSVNAMIPHSLVNRMSLAICSVTVILWMIVSQPFLLM